MSIYLTAQEIVDLAEFCGFSVETFGATDELETEYVVMECPEEGILNEEKTETYHSNMVAYIAEHQEEGIINLGKTGVKR